MGGRKKPQLLALSLWHARVAQILPKMNVWKSNASSTHRKWIPVICNHLAVAQEQEVGVRGGLDLPPTASRFRWKHSKTHCHGEGQVRSSASQPRSWFTQAKMTRVLSRRIRTTPDQYGGSRTSDSRLERVMEDLHDLPIVATSQEGER